MIRALFNLYILIIVIDIILKNLPQYKGHQWVKVIHQASEFSCKPVRKVLLNKVLPSDFPYDISGLVVILCLKIFEALW